MRYLLIYILFCLSTNFQNLYAIGSCNMNNIKEAEADVKNACQSIIDLSKKKMRITDICMEKKKDLFNVSDRENKCYIWVHRISKDPNDAMTVCHPVASGKLVSELVKGKKLDFLHMLHKKAVNSVPMQGVWSDEYDFRGKKKSYLMKCNNEFYVGKTLFEEK